MAAETWSDLPQDLLLTISELLDTDVDILRLRSVCSFWRSSVPPRPRPSPFPLQVPPLLNSAVRSSCVGGRFFLNYSTLYRLSLPEHGPRAGDPSDGWLFRVSEVNPNRFSLLSPLVPDKIEFDSGPIPKHLNLLDYRISEICKCYNLKFVNSMGFTTDLLDPVIWEVTVLRNYTVDGDFLVLVVFSDLTASYWKFGQKSWTPVDTKGLDGISDVAVCKGKCYAVSVEGDLLSFDSDMNLTLDPMPYLPMIHPKTVYYLVEYNSDLYGVERIYEDPSSDDEDNSPFWCEIFKKCETWEHISCLGDAVFLSCEDVSVGFSAEGFRCCKGNSVYVATRNFFRDNHGNNRRVIDYGVYDMAKGEIAFMNAIEDCPFMYWPPPRWLTSG